MPRRRDTHAHHYDIVNLKGDERAPVDLAGCKGHRAVDAIEDPPAPRTPRLAALLAKHGVAGATLGQHGAEAILRCEVRLGRQAPVRLGPALWVLPPKGERDLGCGVSQLVREREIVVEGGGAGGHVHHCGAERTA